MKKFLLALPILGLLIGACGPKSHEEEVNHALEYTLTDKEDFDNAAESFQNGNAKNEEEYFFGILAELIEVDIKFQKVRLLDEQDASEEEITATIDSCLHIIDRGQKALRKYKGKNWHRQKELQQYSKNWFSSIEGLMKNYLRKLAEPMSKPDEEWSDADIDLYNDYSMAYNDYIKVDSIWVAFQYEYAEANNFQLNTTETIDVDALLQEELDEEQEH